MFSIKNLNHIELYLKRREVLNLSHPQPGVAIECEQGLVWLTITGGGKDYTLETGDKYIVKDSASVLIEAVKDAVVELKDQSGEFTIRNAN